MGLQLKHSSFTVYYYFYYYFICCFVLTFLSSLRANLQIPFEDVNSFSNSGSLATTPDCLYPVTPLHPPSTTGDLPSLASLPSDPEDADLTHSPTHISSSQSPTWTYHATTDDDRREALRLIADSVAQQRWFAVRCIVFHPAVLCLALFVLTILVRYAYYHPGTAPIVAAIGAACLAGALIAIYRMTYGYLQLAETVSTFAWLKEGLWSRNNHGDGGAGSAGGAKHHHHHHHLLPAEDEILLTKYGDEIVGVLVLRTARTNALTSGAPSANGIRALRRRQSNSFSSMSGRLTGVIRAWTVKRPYRRRGIGRMLLESAVSICRVRRLDGPIFAEEHHAHAVKLLPWFFNKGFEKQEEWARSLLREVIEGERKTG
ncbi:hypothetical protein VTN96DRAFT_2417 [Rasamsonia emersonii]